MIATLFLLAQAATETVAPAAAAAAQKPTGLAALLSNPLVMVGLFIVIFWVLVLRPQNKARKEHQARLQTLERGDRIVTNAGIHGLVEHVGDTTIKVKIAEGVIIEMEKSVVISLEKKN